MAEDKIVPMPPRLPKVEGQADLPEPSLPSTTAGHLSHSANYAKTVDSFDADPGLGAFFDRIEGEGLGGDVQGPVRTRLGSLPVPALPEVELRPPMFLSPFEAMKDIYLQVKGRSTRRTDELLEGPDLEDLLGLIETMFDSEELFRNAEAKVARKVLAVFEGETGPILTGLNDPRLTEPWRLFVDGWDIWEPKDSDTGVDLFWEGEAEDDDGEEFVILQSLQFISGEAILHTKVGDEEDRITFDGQAFYRLKTPRPAPSS